jgi:hypothetical protein
MATIQTLERGRKQRDVAHEPSAPDPPLGARQAVRRIAVTPFARMALVLWTCAGIAMLFVLVDLWVLLRASGSLANFEEFVRDLTGVEQFEVQSVAILGSIAVLVALAVVVATLLSVCAVLIYNAVAPLVGGIEISVAAECVDGPAGKASSRPGPDGEKTPAR